MPEDFRRHSSVDRLLSGAGRALATLSGVAPAVRAMPVAGGDPAEPADPAERRLSGR